jgi:hypothetical protein
MSIILILVIIIIVLIKLSKQKIENFCDNSTINHKKKKTKSKKDVNTSLKIVNEYYRQDLPVYIKIDAYDKINKNVLSKYKNRLTIIDIEYIKISKYPGYINYYLEVFILDNTTYTTNKFIIDYTIKNGDIFTLNDMRIYNFKDDQLHKDTNNNIYGINSNLVETRKNLSNPFIDNSLNPTIQLNNTSTLEYSNLQKELLDEVNKNILNKDITKFNSVILPKHITDKSLYMTMTPDFFNINVYPVEINNDIFSRTRGIPSFPTGISI